MARKKTTPEFPKCPFRHADCFARLPGCLCHCLENTDFESGRECPFYKTEKEFMQDAELEDENDG